VAISPKSLIVGVIAEPPAFGPFTTYTSGGGAHQLHEIAQRFLVTLDDHSQAQPDIASALPSLESGTWTVLPDGTMQTTFKLRPNVYWHDGTPMHADDWVFGWEIDKDAALPNSALVPIKYVDSVTAPDDSTLVMHWTQTYPYANRLLRGDLEAVQRSRLESAYQAGPDRLLNNPAWTTEFIGLGPFRLAQWSPGSQIRYEAFDRFYRGRPRIDVLTVRFLQDQNTLLSNILSDAIDVYLPLGVTSQGVQTLQGSWAAPGTGNQLLVYLDGRLRFLEVQTRPDYVKPAALSDPRVRAAIYRAVDRAPIMDALTNGYGQVADSWILPDDPSRNTVFAGVIPDYSRNPTAAQQLMEQAGFRRGPDGGFVNTTTGERFATSVWNTPGSGGDQESAITADQMRTFGIATEEVLVPASKLNDREFRAQFPGLSVTSLTSTLEFENGEFRYREPTRTLPLGAPRGGYNNPQVNALIDKLEGTVAETDRSSLQRQIMQVVMQELPIMPLYWNVETMTIRKGVTGPAGRTGRNVTYPLATWNIDTWDRT
jgi:peptide/nickel transport system substrate-binding protein